MIIQNAYFVVFVILLVEERRIDMMPLIPVLVWQAPVVCLVLNNLLLRYFEALSVLETTFA